MAATTEQIGKVLVAASVDPCTRVNFKNARGKINQMMAAGFLLI
ncbi:hypothetical protein [Phaeobacter sp. NW0010-22]